MGIKVIQLTSKSHHENLLASLHQMRMQGQLCDVTIQVSYQEEVEEFQAHQLILAASSGYFQKILLSQDANRAKLQLSNMHSSDFSKYLEFVYTGKIEVARNKIGDVQEVARLLDCEGLSVVCSDALSAGVLERPKSKTCDSKVKDGGGELPGAEKVDAKKQPLKRQLSSQSPKKQDRKKKLKAKTFQRKTTNQVKKLKLKLAGRKVLQRRLRYSLKDDPKDKNQANESEDRTGEDSEPENEEDLSEEQENIEGRASDNLDFEEDAQSNDPQDSLYVDEEEEEDDEDEEGQSEEEVKRISKAQFSCNKCQRTFHYEKSYLKHISTYHGVKAHVIHRCETCMQTFANSSNLKIHEKHVHSNERLFACDSCSKTFKRKKDVVRHKRQVHERNMRHVCAECGKSLSSRAALLLHERTHTGLKPYECTVCGAKFTQNSALKMHHRTHTGEKPYACDLCDSRFSQRHMLAYHKRSHTGEKPFMCESCGKSFASKEYLRHHSNIHTGSKPYKCEHCGRGFAQRNSLNQHLKIHTGERPYSCKSCDKHFTQLNALQRHQRIHTGEKPYMCGLCKRTFTDKSTLRRHTMIHGSDVPWKTYLVVLEGNVEEKKPKSPTKEKGGSEEKRSTASKSSSSPVPTVHAVDDADKSSTETVVVPTEPVTLPADWARHGAITLVSHGGVGAITVIHTEVPPGTQIQPIGTSTITLDGSAIAVPFSIPVSVAQTLSSEAPSGSLSVPTLSVPVSETLLASDISTTSLLEAAAAQAVLAPPSENNPTSESDKMHPDIETVIVGEGLHGKEQEQLLDDGQNKTADEAETTKDQSSV
ncbi:PREDICTED: GDNF-inducible zinc finger protein 1 [Poecilia mexicana]|uniref:GDNF-inducible zinc finger protein 1 n=1 Tax=Poecilia mexicana TaxID=48701 RepID=UPI00072EB475|nr:PREDICTED: GDNF-inducible zinc finger protein 1 [Poecilia mexicana]XP_014861409.1 PREDICTED: GDNF-inducible zinc finger protein 1 [Poecilia mexicana]